MISDVQVLVYCGLDIVEWFDVVVGLWVSVFCSFFYLYEGDIEYEKYYFVMYVCLVDSLLVFVFVDDVVVGVFMGLLFGDVELVFQVLFVD